MTLKTPLSIVNCISGAKGSDIEVNLKLLSQDNHRLGKIVIHIGSNDIQFKSTLAKHWLRKTGSNLLFMRDALYSGGVKTQMQVSAGKVKLNIQLYC